MRIFKHIKTKRIYGRTADGRVYILTGYGEWSPSLHTPTTGMMELPEWEYRTTYQSFKGKVGE